MFKILLNLSEDEKLFELSMDKTLEIKFNGNKNNLLKFWILIYDQCHPSGEKAIKLLLPFSIPG